jgi:hypothetical protein
MTSCTPRVIALCMILMVPASVQAEWLDSRRLTAQFGPYTYHYRHDPEHQAWTRMMGLEWEFRPQWIAGASVFRNSFDQDSQYVYVGKRWALPALGDNAYFKLSGGLLMGYRPPYHDKIPFNRNGVALAAVPAIGYQHDRFNVQLNILGTAGFLITFGYDLRTWD